MKVQCDDAAADDMEQKQTLMIFFPYQNVLIIIYNLKHAISAIPGVKYDF